MLLIQIHRYISQRSQRQPCVGRFWSLIVVNRGTTLALVITSSGQILNIFFSFSHSLFEASLFAFWRHFDLCCALSALCVHCVMLHIFTIMIVKMLRFMLIIIMAGTCHMPSRLRALTSFMACWFLFDTHKYGDQMELAMRRSLRSEQRTDSTVWGLATGRSHFEAWPKWDHAR